MRFPSYRGGRTEEHRQVAENRRKFNSEFRESTVRIVREIGDRTRRQSLVSDPFHGGVVLFVCAES